MRKKILLGFYLFSAFLFTCTLAQAQLSWKQCAGPAFTNRVDDVFMVNTQIGYAVSGDGMIVKTTDGGDHWNLLNQDTSIYCRSVEFINPQLGFVGAFSEHHATANIFRKTTDGGATWTDLTPSLNPYARNGICGLCVADSMTVYGCGNFFQDTGYIVKSVDAGNTWTFIDMHAYASSMIDMYFLNKDTGFVTGRSPLPAHAAIILYTTDGGQTWATKFQSTVNSEYCWKIQHLTDSIYFASIEDFTITPSKILKSTDGGMSWTVYNVVPTNQDMEGIGFIDSLHGWSGGLQQSFESTDGGVSWSPAAVCPYMNRVFKLNDTLMFASGTDIWKYSKSSATGISAPARAKEDYAFLDVFPNPVSESFNLKLTLTRATHPFVSLIDEQGRTVKYIVNMELPVGVTNYKVDVHDLPSGTYYVVLRSYSDQVTAKVQVNHR